VKAYIASDAIRDENDGPVFYLPSFVLGLIPGSRGRGVRRIECRSGLAWEKDRMTAVSREETDKIEYLLTLVVCLPRSDDRGRNRLDPRHSCAPHSLPTRSTLRVGL
jgi:hypothetical protein